MSSFVLRVVLRGLYDFPASLLDVSLIGFKQVILAFCRSPPVQPLWIASSLRVGNVRHSFSKNVHLCKHLHKKNSRHNPDGPLAHPNELENLDF